MTGALRSYHRDIDISRWNNLRKMQAKTMSRHQHFAGSESRANVALENLTVVLIWNEQHDNISLLSCIGRSENTQPLRPRFLAALAASRQTDDNVNAIITHVECMSMPLAAVTNYRNTFALNKF